MTVREPAPVPRTGLWISWVLFGVLLVAGIALALVYGGDVTPLLDTPRLPAPP